MRKEDLYPLVNIVDPSQILLLNDVFFLTKYIVPDEKK